jgi:glycosyltransferase involved in cell wall biosynthesis
MCKTIARRDEEIVLFFGATSYLLPVAFGRLLGRTVVVEPRGDVPLSLRLQWEQRIPVPLARLLSGLVWGLERSCYRLADALITYTPGMADQLDLQSYEQKLHPHGARYIDTEEFSPQVSFEEREQVVGYLGRLDEEKGIRRLSAVARRLPDSLTFRFLGDGDLTGWLETQLAEEIESGSVEMAGWIDHDEVPGAVSQLRLLIVPSEPTEGLPTVILESLACGTPVYATPVSGVVDVVREGETGFLLTEDRPATVANRIETISDRADLDEISANGRALIEDEYSFDAAVKRYRHIFQRL